MVDKPRRLSVMERAAAAEQRAHDRSVASDSGTPSSPPRVSSPRPHGMERAIELATAKESASPMELDPSQMAPSLFIDRLKIAYTDADAAYVDLKESIRATGFNVQPCLVRVKAGGPGVNYELLDGHRRWTACTDLKMKVRVVVITLDEGRDERQQIAQIIEAANKNQQPISPYERAMKYKRLLDEKVYASQDALAAGFEVTKGSISQHMKIAALPSKLIELIRDPREITHSVATQLWAFLDGDPSIVDSLGDLFQPDTTYPVGKVLERLGEGSGPAGPVPCDITVDGKSIGSVTRSKKAVRVSVKLALDEVGATELARLVGDWFSHRKH